jgi:hypothetical protein
LDLVAVLQPEHERPREEERDAEHEHDRERVVPAVVVACGW